MNNNKKVIVFDLDDTLYKEQDFLISAYKEIATYIEKRYTIKYIFEKMIENYHQHKNVFEELIKQYGTMLTLDKLLYIYRHHEPKKCYVETDVFNILTSLASQKNVFLGIMTDGRSITQRNKIRCFQLSKFFNEDMIIISEEFGSKKPDIKNYLFFMNKVPNASYYYIGDNTFKDFITPNTLRWTSICLLDNENKNIHKQDFSLPIAYLPQYKVDNLSDILTIIYK